MLKENYSLDFHLVATFHLHVTHILHRNFSVAIFHCITHTFYPTDILVHILVFLLVEHPLLYSYKIFEHKALHRYADIIRIERMKRMADNEPMKMQFILIKMSMIISQSVKNTYFKYSNAVKHVGKGNIMRKVHPKCKI